MYVKLILRNARRSIGDYLIYIVTLTLCVAMFYAFLSISSSYYKPEIGAQFDLGLLGDNMKAAICVITLLLLFLVRYVNRFMVYRKQKEFAIQTIMGMEQKLTARLFFFETLIMGGAALLIGCLLGGLLAQLITAMQLSSMGYPYRIIWTLYPDTLLLTVVFFLVSFVGIGLFNIRTIRKIKVIDMLQADKVNETLKKSRWMHGIIYLFALFLMMVLAAGISKRYYYFDPRLPGLVHVMFAANIGAPALGLMFVVLFPAGRLLRRKMDITVLTCCLLAADLLLIVSAASVPILQQKYSLALGKGTINLYAMFILAEIGFAVCAFMYLTGHLAEGKKKNRQWACREENLFFLGQILTKLRTTTKTMTLICLTLMVSIGLFLSIPALVGWASGYLEERAVFDIRMASTYNRTEKVEELPDTGYGVVTDFLEEEGIAVADDCTLSVYFPREELFYNRLKSDFPVLAVSLSDYNHLRRMVGLDAVSLEEGTFTTQWRSTASEEEAEAFLEENPSVETDAGTLRLAPNRAHHAGISENVYNLYTDVIYVFPDSVCGKLLGAERQRYINTAEPVPYETCARLEALFGETLPTDINRDGVIYLIRTRSIEVSDTTTGIFILKTSMTYAAVVLFIICFTILALQQLLDGSQYSYRFGVLRKLGVEDTRINRLIFRQLAFWFGLPVCTAAAGAAIFAVYFFRTISVQISAYVGTGKLMGQVGAVVVILSVLLACYFISTWILFRRQVFE